MRPFIHFRFGRIESGRIGHFTQDVEAYLCAIDGNKPKNTVDLIYCPEPTSNEQLKLMWKRSLCILPFWRFWSALDHACRHWLQGNYHTVSLFDRSKDHKLIGSKPTHLKFTPEEDKRGQELLRKLGLPLGVPWVCIHNRDSAYLDNKIGAFRTYHGAPGYDLHRNFKIKSLINATNEFVSRGFYVIRVGSIVSEPFKHRDKRVIDYPLTGLQCDFLDLYLLSKCDFYFGSDSGISTIPFVFGKPVCTINYNSTLIYQLIDRNIAFPFIFKRLFKESESRYLTLEEIYLFNYEGMDEAILFINTGIKVISNTCEEIHKLSIEMLNRIQGQWQAEPGDDELQNLFWEIYNKYAKKPKPSNCTLKVGASFLRNNKDLLRQSADTSIK